MSYVKIEWNEIFRLCKEIKDKFPDKKFWGVPRGGQVIAGILGNAVDSVEECDIIVDDIIDSGRTEEKFKKYNKPFIALFDLRKIETNDWLIFPWEKTQNDIEDNVVRLLQYFGEDVNREGLKDTPKRYVKFFKEFLNPPKWKCTTFEGEGYDEMIIQKNIPFYSLCEHHIAPFFGKGHIAYIPNKKIVGLSKLARTLETYSRRLQNQERITQQVAEFLEKQLKPKGVAVILSAQHMCMEMRGVKKHDTFTTTSKMTGVFKTGYEARMELMNLIKNE
jgi:GTP cyclohydrolase I